MKRYVVFILAICIFTHLTGCALFPTASPEVTLPPETTAATITPTTESTQPEPSTDVPGTSVQIPLLHPRLSLLTTHHIATNNARNSALGKKWHYRWPRYFVCMVKDGCIFKHCANYSRENRSWMSDLGALVHGGIMRTAPAEREIFTQCLENTHP